MDSDQLYASRVSPSLDCLPPELICMIVDCIFSADDKAEDVNRNLLAITVVSKRLHCLLTRFLYKHNVQRMDSRGLHWAVANNNITVTEQLLKHGGSITSAAAGNPVLLAAKNGYVELLKLLLSTAKKDQVSEALTQTASDEDEKWTALHWAIYRADVPCVKALLEAGADTSITDTNGKRPVDLILEKSQSELVGRYAQIVELLLVRNHAEIFRSPEVTEPFLRIENHLGWRLPNVKKIGSTTPLIMAAKRNSLEIGSMLIDAALQRHNEDGKLARFINARDKSGMAALDYLCKSFQWSYNQGQRGRAVAIARLLILHGADVNNGSIYDGPLYLCCSKTRFLVYRQALNTLGFQRDMICLLLDNGADANNKHESIWKNICFHALVEFLDTAGDYCNVVPHKPYLEPNDISEDVHRILQEGDSTNETLEEGGRRSVTEEVDSDPICKILREILGKILERVEDVNVSHGLDMTPLHRAVTIPGILGLWATWMLLQKGASQNATDKSGRSARDRAIRDANKAAIALMGRWSWIQLKRSEMNEVSKCRQIVERKSGSCPEYEQRRMNDVE